MGMLKEFREFAVKGNVVDMAVGVIIGAAFGKIVSSLVNDVIMPPLGLVMGKLESLSQLKFPLRDGIEINFGRFLTSVVDFVIVAFVIFLFIKQINRVKRLGPAPTPTTRECPLCCSTITVRAKRCPHCTADL